jgi:hypothetical protein
LRDIFPIIYDGYTGNYDISGYCTDRSFLEMLNVSKLVPLNTILAFLTGGTSLNEIASAQSLRTSEQSDMTIEQSGEQSAWTPQKARLERLENALAVQQQAIQAQDDKFNQIIALLTVGNKGPGFNKNV